MDYELTDVDDELMAKETTGAGRPKSKDPDFPFKTMEPGQAFMATGEVEYGRARTAIWALNKYSDKEFAGSRKSLHRWIIWRKS